MAQQSRGWFNGSSPGRSSKLEACYREPEFPLDEATREKLNNMKYIWGNCKRCEPLKRMLHEYFSSGPNPYMAALDILVNCDDFRLAKINSLAYTVMDEFSHWINNRDMEYQHCLTEDVKLTAFDRMTKQHNFSLVKMICRIYKMAEHSELFLNSLRHLLLNKQYKEVCQIAALLNLHRHFSVEDFLVPLIFQDKLTVAEEFLIGSTSHQRDLVVYFDNLLGKRNIRNEADIIASTLKIPEVHPGKLYYKPLSKLVSRLTKQFDLPPSACPNLNLKRSEGALQFLIHKRFQENSLGAESWREMVREAVGNNSRLQSDLVSVVGNYEPKEAYYFANEFNIPRSRWPYSVENYFVRSVESRPSVDLPEKNHSKVIQEDNDESWDTEGTFEYHTLSLSNDQIILVDNEKSFQCFLQDISSNAIPVVGIDSEWKPYFGTKKNELALMQIATKHKVYILDVMTIGKSHEDLWQRLGSELFENERIIKLGFGLQADIVMAKHSLPYLGVLLQSASSCLDMLLLWKRLVRDYSLVFPFSENTMSSGESLTHLVELCLGRQLDKSDQFSNWERRPLRPSQITYAALDAYCLLEIYDVIQERSTLQEIPLDEVVQDVLSTNKTPKKSSKHHKKHTKCETPIEVGPPPFTEPISPDQLKVVCDCTVEGLGKHLRICGVDTIFIRQNEHFDKCVRIANKEGRMVITRGRHVWKKVSKHLQPGHCYAVQSDNVDNQLKEVFEYFNVVLSKDYIFSRCQVCNGNEFAKVSQETMKKLLATCQRVSACVTADEDDSCKWDADGFSSESDACSDEGLAGPCTSNNWQQTSEIIEGVDVNKCLTRKGVFIQVTSIPAQRIEELPKFNVCETCGKCYWDGTHLNRYMNSTLQNITILQ